jgi:Ca2+-binding EF-hand superfamily protein
LYERMDVNKNGMVERQELLTFFAQDFVVKGVQVPQDVELLFDAMDMNRDALLSVNEFCLCLEGV